VPCRRFVVSGRVQGVWFRASTRQQAEQLGLSGHAVNLPDGRVEVVACGSEAAVEALATWLWRGPELASVTDVAVVDLGLQQFSGFSVG
jgi:acylphosphatase